MEKEKKAPRSTRPESLDCGAADTVRVTSGPAASGARWKNFCIQNPFSVLY